MTDNIDPDWILAGLFPVDDLMMTVIYGRVV